MSKILVATAVAIMIASTGAASAKTRHHYRHGAPNAQMNTPGQPGAYGSPGNLTPGYSSTARHKPADTNGGGQ
jgi:hypothetical protein